MDPAGAERPSDRPALKGAIYNGYLEVVVLDARVDALTSDSYGLLVAITQGQLEVVPSLLVHGRVNPAANDGLALHLASAKGHLEVVILLLNDK